MTSLSVHPTCRFDLHLKSCVVGGGYSEFLQKFKSDRKASHPDEQYADMRKAATAVWKAFSETDLAPYVQQFARKKEEWLRRTPNVAIIIIVIIILIIIVLTSQQHHRQH